MKRKGRGLENLQSLEKKVSKERVRGIPEQIVVCPGPLDAPRQLKGKILVEIHLLKKLGTYLYGLSRKCCHKGCRRGLPPNHGPLKKTRGENEKNPFWFIRVFFGSDRLSPSAPTAPLVFLMNSLLDILFLTWGELRSTERRIREKHITYLVRIG